MTRTPHDPEAARRRLLDPHLNRLREWNHRIPGIEGDRAATVIIGKHRLRVESRERAVIEHWAPDREAPSADSRLVMDSLLLMIKLLTEMEQSDTTSAPAARNSAEILLSVALGVAILRQLQPLASKPGATLWSGLKSRIENVLAQARVHLGSDVEERIPALSATFEIHSPQRRSPAPEARAVPLPSTFPLSLLDELTTEHAVAAAALTDDDDEEEFDLPEQLRALAEPPSRLSRRTRAALLICACSLLLWALTVRLPEMWGGSPVQFDLSAIESLEWVDHVTARTASLYVETDTDAWRALPQAARWQAMKQLVESASQTGARGMLLRGEDDRALAQWIEGRGIVLHEEPNIDSPQVTNSNADWRKRVGQPSANPEYPEMPAF